MMTIGLYSQSIWRLRNSNSQGSVDIGFNFGTQETGWQSLASYRGGQEAVAMMAQSVVAAPLRIIPTPNSTLEVSVTEEVIVIATETDIVPTNVSEITPEATEPAGEITPTSVPTADATNLATETVVSEEPVVEPTEEHMTATELPTATPIATGQEQ
jgi:hypothetical protein